MSMFLGPIHQWLYNKIQNGAERASAIEEAYKGAFGAEADAIISGLDENYPAFPVGIPLEDIIGDAQIHPFLMGLIRMVETREGALVKAFTDKYSDRAVEIAIDGRGVRKENRRRCKRGDYFRRHGISFQGAI